MRVQENQFSMQVMLEKAKLSKDGSVPIAIRLTVSGRTKRFYLGIKILPERFCKEAQLVKLTTGNLTEAKAINKIISKAKKKLCKQWGNYRLFRRSHRGAIYCRVS